MRVAAEDAESCGAISVVRFDAAQLRRTITIG